MNKSKHMEAGESARYPWQVRSLSILKLAAAALSRPVV